MSSWLCCASWRLPHLCWTLWLKVQNYFRLEGPKILKIHLIFSHVGVSGAAASIAAIPLSLSLHPKLWFQTFLATEQSSCCPTFPEAGNAASKPEIPLSSWNVLSERSRKAQQEPAGAHKAMTRQGGIPPHSLHPQFCNLYFVHFFVCILELYVCIYVCLFEL